MVVDASALLAVFMAEEDAAYFAEQLASTSELLIPAPALLEACIFVLRKEKTTGRGLDALAALVAESGCRVTPFASGDVARAAEAYGKFGKGVHPAKLNFGDCMVYAIAKKMNLPLLCKGNDFVQTDLTCITPPRA